jgi:hypothetical protein
MKVKVEFEVEVPCGVTDGNFIEEWLRYELGDNGSMDGDNPLCGEPVEPIWGSFDWEVV